MSEERRFLKDRRSKPTRPISRYTFIGRRKKGRRVGELDNYYVDRYESHLAALIGLIIVFCVLDVFFSLEIERLGGVEWNYLMSIFMGKNLTLSIILKIIITIVCAFFLLIHKNFKLFRFIKAPFFIYLTFTIYLLLILYESYSLIVLHQI